MLEDGDGGNDDRLDELVSASRSRRGLLTYSSRTRARDNPSYPMRIPVDPVRVPEVALVDNSLVVRWTGRGI